MLGTKWGNNLEYPSLIHILCLQANELMELMDRGKHNTVSEKLKGMFQENPDEAYNVGMELIKILISRVCNTTVVSRTSYHHQFGIYLYSTLVKLNSLPLIVRYQVESSWRLH